MIIEHFLVTQVLTRAIAVHILWARDAIKTTVRFSHMSSFSSSRVTALTAFRAGFLGKSYMTLSS